MQAMGYKRRYDSDDEAERDMGYDLLGFQREAAWPVVVLFETGETCRKPNPNRVEACQAMPNQNHVKCQESGKSCWIQIQDFSQTSEVERRCDDRGTRGWPRDVLIVGWGAKPKMPVWWKGGNPIEVVTSSKTPAIFHNLADLMRMKVEELKPLGQIKSQPTLIVPQTVQMLWTCNALSPKEQHNCGLRSCIQGTACNSVIVKSKCSQWRSMTCFWV